MRQRAATGWMSEWGVPVSGAFLVHVAAAVLVSVTLVMPARILHVEPTVIDAEVIDARTIDAEAQRLRDRMQAEQRAAAAAVAAKKAREVERELAEAAAAAAAQAEKRRARDAEVAKARSAQLKRERDASAQQAREDDLKQQLAAEERRSKMLRSGELEKYKAAVVQKVERNWIKPAALPANLDCLVVVEQLPTGDVVRAEVVSCNGDENAQRSIESAVLRASPLPLPSDRSLWERSSEFRFHPGAKK
jgi:colicin import membrane protein